MLPIQPEIIENLEMCRPVKVIIIIKNASVWRDQLHITLQVVFSVFRGDLSSTEHASYQDQVVVDSVELTSPPSFWDRLRTCFFDSSANLTFNSLLPCVQHGGMTGYWQDLIFWLSSEIPCWRCRLSSFIIYELKRKSKILTDQVVKEMSRKH